MASVVNAAEQAAVADQFATLADRGKSATALLSSTTAMVNHPTYQAIISLGPLALPLLLRELEREPVHWPATAQLERHAGAGLPATFCHPGGRPRRPNRFSSFSLRYRPGHAATTPGGGLTLVGTT
jgi:hypothetical protein